MLIRILFFLMLPSAVFAQCTECTPPFEIPANVGSDAFYFAQPDTGQYFAAYDGQWEFRMPDNTSDTSYLNGVQICAAPSLPCGLAVSSVEVASISGLPAVQEPGGWELTFDQPNATYTGGATGCVRLCGTPMEVGSFIAEVELIVCTSTGICGPLSVYREFVIETDTNCHSVANDGFEMSCFNLCLGDTVEYTNLMPDTTDANVTFSWDLGTVSTTDEHPVEVIYLDEGQYQITYTREEFDYVLTRITVSDLPFDDDCNDVFDGPDVFGRIYHPDDLNTPIATTIVSANTDPGDLPITFFVNVVLEPGVNYILDFKDQDTTTGDDLCGTVNFTATTTGQLINSGLTVELNIDEVITETQTFSEMLYVDSIFCYMEPIIDTTTVDTTTVDTTGIGILEVIGLDEFTIYPNPSTAGITRIRMERTAVRPNLDIIIRDIYGREERLIRLPEDAGQQTITVRDLPLGTHLISLRDNGIPVLNRKLIVLQ